MNEQSSQSYRTIASAIVIAGVLISASVFVAVGDEATTKTTTSTVTETSVLTSTTTATQTLIGSSSYYSCYADSPGTGTYLRAISDSNQQPFWDIAVTASPVDNGTCYGQATVPAVFNTNSSGWASLGALEGGAYFGVSFGYGGQGYNFSLPQESLYETTAVVHLPSGDVSVTLCHDSVCTTRNLTATITQLASTNALRLQLSVNASGDSVSIIADDFNTLTSTDNITAGVKWLVQLSYLDGAPCSGNGWPVGFAVASGHYTSSNVTAAKFLDLVNPGVTYNCPNTGPFGNAVGYSFGPLSDTATGYDCLMNTCGTWVVSTGLTPSLWGAATGYWNQGGTFTSFQRGTYTVLAEDEWGHTTLAYFTIP